MVQFRSETMKHGTLVIPSDRAHEFVDVLGRNCNIELVDMNASSGHRQYKKYIQRVDEMERILRFLVDEINKLPGATIVKHQVEDFLEHDHYTLDGVEESLKKLYAQFVKFRENNADLQQAKDAAIEERAVAIAATRSLSPDLSNVVTERSHDGSHLGLLESNDVEFSGESDMVGFSNVAGVIAQIDQERFARTIFRATRGNAYTHFETIQDQVVDHKSGKQSTELKNVFVIYHQGTVQSAVAERIVRISNAFGVRRYNWPRSFREATNKIHELDEVIADRSHALEAYEEYFIGEIAVLLEVMRDGGNSLVEEWRLFCLKEKAIFAALNMFEGSDVTLRADCWYPSAEDGKIRELLRAQSNKQQVSALLLDDYRPLSTALIPPTYFRCPEFTQGFQDFVNTYGVPRYKEANPALCTIVTLPFLFGIMYGDVGHGAVVFMAGIYMVVMWHSKLKFSDSEVVHMVGGGRYMILLMGAFATYAGFLYNDFLALGMDLFGTRYVKSGEINGLTQYARDPTQTSYPFGFDPIWKGATNEIDFFNSFKMKFAVIIAFVQMGGGILHKGLNAVFFKDTLTFWFEFLPQFVFLTCLVGYMDFLIVYKWMTDLSHPKPNIITTFINMFFFKTEDPFWSNQGLIQSLLVLLMLVSIPLMLFPKPFILKERHASSKKNAALSHCGDEISILKDGGDSDYQPRDAGGHHTAIDDPENPTSPDVPNATAAPEETFDFAEEFIHQMIETIEFVLGAISNTASYLRLWALSLAHQQLALVFFENTVLRVLEISSLNVVVLGVLTFIAFGCFAMVTLGIMLGMDSLECFLHALRLQWVEFQSKFFKADGRLFTPFSLLSALTEVKTD